MAASAADGWGELRLGSHNVGAGGLIGPRAQMAAAAWTLLGYSAVCGQEAHLSPATASAAEAAAPDWAFYWAHGPSGGMSLAHLTAG